MIHNGFNQSSYAYCSKCGMTALLDTGHQGRPVDGLPPDRAITSGGEKFLAPCECGGAFLPGASPRCPHCDQKLSAEAMAEWLEPGSEERETLVADALQRAEKLPKVLRDQVRGSMDKAFRWQRDWEGLYALIVDERVVHNPWRDGRAPS